MGNSIVDDVAAINARLRQIENTRKGPECMACEDEGWTMFHGGHVPFPIVCKVCGNPWGKPAP